MRIKSVRLRSFKRFTDLTVQGIPETVRLVILAGPNGTGKSSFFDGLRTWHSTHGSPNPTFDGSYHSKTGASAIDNWPDHVELETHETPPDNAADRRKLIYQRSAFRNEAEFELNGLSRLPDVLDITRVNRMIDNDSSVSDNYQRLILETLDGVYSDKIPDSATKGELRERLIGQIRASMSRVFPDLLLQGVGDPLQGGSFYFVKNGATRFPYKNLSAGEKSAFDLLLDMVVKRGAFDDTAWCIDEPETHLNTRIQGSLLTELMELLPKNSQLWLASHSIGYMSGAWQLYKDRPGEVAFLDFEGQDFDSPVVIEPIAVDREFWRRTLDVALGDLSKLIAPEEVVLCEGRPPQEGQALGGGPRAEFDARCYRAIFAKVRPNTDFLSVGNNQEVANDYRYVGTSIQAIAPGARIIRVVDRDLKNATEVAEHVAAGTRVLTRRHLESYLLDDEVLTAFCEVLGKSSERDGVLQDREDARAASVSRGNDPDDDKKIVNEFYTALRRRLNLTATGSTWSAFAVEYLAPLLQAGMSAFSLLENDLFGEEGINQTVASPS